MVIGRPAVFLDRDGTLTEPRHYPSSPEDLVLSAGVGAPLRALYRLGVALVVVTNQSGVARGLFGRPELDAMHRHLRDRLAELGVPLDAVLDCPHHPDGVVTALAVTCDCRKPAPGMLLRAARQLDLDVAGSWMIGDFDSDVEAGRRAGCRTALVRAGSDDGSYPSSGRPDLRVPSTEQALCHIVGLHTAARTMVKEHS
ncbi:D-glycero-alpha-D-manno-heptose-1,7-bisphosphate 7-phosphatase [Streptomyces sp. NPDC020898]|uniref:D-glycero-alpha-D-manno-heptose-1,7-bisphosphate 7-phosphatase n=1 Tax=Streptomyces sp. NPDC020898 TaxID=3365101 RepID=UPI0037921F30